MNAVKPYWKAILAFVSLLATNVSADLMNGGPPWPQNAGEWARWLVTQIVGTYAVYRVPKYPVSHQ